MIKSLKQSFVALMLITSASLCNPITADWNQEAAIWATKLLTQQPSNQELALVLNLLYYSYARSQATIEATQAILKHLENCKQITSNCLGSRLNPSKLPFYEYAIDQADNSHANFINATRTHQTISATYARALEHILDNHALPANQEEHIQELRTSARIAMATAISGQLVDVKQAFNSIERLMNAAKRGVDMLADDDEDMTTRSNRDFMWNISPYFALNSFAKFDKNYNTFNATLWKSLITSYTLGDILWQAFEGARAELYKAHYIALYNQLTLMHVPEAVFVGLFDPHGNIKTAEKGEKLPEPNNIASKPFISRYNPSSHHTQIDHSRCAV